MRREKLIVLMIFRGDLSWLHTHCGHRSSLRAVARIMLKTYKILTGRHYAVLGSLSPLSKMEFITLQRPEVLQFSRRAVWLAAHARCLGNRLHPDRQPREPIECWREACLLMCRRNALSLVMLSTSLKPCSHRTDCYAIDEHCWYKMAYFTVWHCMPLLWDTQYIQNIAYMWTIPLSLLLRIRSSEYGHFLVMRFSWTRLAGWLPGTGPTRHRRWLHEHWALSISSFSDLLWTSMFDGGPDQSP